MVIFEAFLVVMELVKDFVSHTIAGSIAEAVAASHIGKSFNLAGSAGSLSLAYAAVFIVSNVGRGKAGTGAAGNGTAAAGDTSLIVLVPHRMLF